MCIHTIYVYIYIYIYMYIHMFKHKVNTQHDNCRGALVAGLRDAEAQGGQRKRGPDPNL